MSLHLILIMNKVLNQTKALIVQREEYKVWKKLIRRSLLKTKSHFSINIIFVTQKKSTRVISNKNYKNEAF